MFYKPHVSLEKVSPSNNNSYIRWETKKVMRLRITENLRAASEKAFLSIMTEVGISAEQAKP